MIKVQDSLRIQLIGFGVIQTNCFSKQVPLRIKRNLLFVVNRNRLLLHDTWMNENGQSQRSSAQYIF